ncbi:uncharacterized protein LOC131801684 [Musca domestica]|uniref:Uncharacterized protein LOC131801684 n=1 Tax=Musca domestica TaxID=7370 RepID=A0ABM3USS9_MUSDO|nr:uncharacterized protein LOC131801684 [Musca domestica]
MFLFSIGNMKYFVVLGLLALLAVGQAQNDENETTTVDPSEDEGDSSPSPPPPPPPHPPKRPEHGRPGHGRPGPGQGHDRPEPGHNRPGPLGFFQPEHRLPLPRPLEFLRNVFSPVKPHGDSQREGPEANAHERDQVAFIFGSGKVKGKSFSDYSSGHNFGGNSFGDTYGQGIVVGEASTPTTTTTAAAE